LGQGQQDLHVWLKEDIEMGFLQLYAIGGLIILSMMIALWLISLLLRDSSIVDIFWGTGFVIANWAYFILTPDGFIARKWLVSVLVTIWGLRLSLHILQRNWGRGEDFRYQAWRKEAGARWWWLSFFKVFLLQGVFLWIISAPLLAAQAGVLPGHLIWLDYLAVVMWVVGFTFEAVGDWQLMQFKANPANKGKLLTSGLWRYTRHPNYFGDAAQWWGYYLLALAAGGWWTIFSPLFMTYLLRNVSGVAMLEKSLVNTKPGFKEYVESTPAFVPWLPRKK
jgi:steroid 5-alpha reductase family enzyme